MSQEPETRPVKFSDLFLGDTFRFAGDGEKVRLRKATASGYRDLSDQRMIVLGAPPGAHVIRIKDQEGRLSP